MASTKEEYERKKQALIALLGGRCVRCGSQEDLEFDHIDRATKSFTILENWGLSMERLLPELRKCQLLCGDCHAEKSLEAGDHGGRTEHGSRGMYTRKKCRCPACTEAQTTYMREYKRRRKQRDVAQ